MRTKIGSKTKHEQLKQILKEELLSGKYLPGAKFYSQNRIAEYFHISPITAREATAALVQEGFLTRSQGKGTFVTDYSELTNSRNLGLVVHHSELFTLSLFGEVNRGITTALDNTEYHSLLIPFKEENSLEAGGKFLVSLARKKKLDGLLITACQVPRREILSLQKEKIAFVLVNCFLPRAHCDFVCPDYSQCSYLLTKHLLGNGYRPVIYFGGYGEKFSIEKERLLGYRKALKESNLSPDGTYEIDLPFESRDKIHPQLKHLGNLLDSLKRKNGGIGIICGDDLMAYDVCKYLNRKGYRIPEDIGIAGLGNFRFSESFDPPLTTVEYPKSEMGEIAVRILLEKLKERKEGQGKAKNIFLKPELIIRQSSMRKERRYSSSEARNIDDEKIAMSSA